MSRGLAALARQESCEPTPPGDAEPAGDKGLVRSGLRGAGSLMLAGLIANSANIVVTFVLSHFLSSRNYGAFNQLVYLFLALSMPGYAVVVAVVRHVSRLESAGRHQEVAHWVRRWRAVSVVIVVATLAASLAAGGILASAISLPDASGIAPILTAGAVWLLLSIDRGLIQAYRRYNHLARNLVVEGLVRTSGTMALVAAGIGVRGAMLGILASALCADADARITLRAERRHPPQPSATSVRDTSGAAGDFIAALLSLALLASLAGLDVIILGRLAPRQSGAYAAIAVTSKVLFFAALVLSGYLLPEAATRRHRGQHAFHQLGVTVSFLAVLTVIGEAIALTAARPVLGLVFPARLLTDAGDQAELIAAMAMLAVNVILTYYLLGIGRRSVVAVLAGGTALLAALLVSAGGRPAMTVRSDLIAQACLMGALCLYLLLAGKPVASRSGTDRVSEPAFSIT